MNPLALHVKDPREDKLPAWARDLVRELRRRVTVLETALGSIPAEDATAWLDQLTEDRRPVARTHDRVSFTRRPDGRGPWLGVRLLEDDGEVVTVELMGSGALRLSPQVTNVVRVEVLR